MTLEDQIKQTMSNLENTSSDEILEIITQIMPNFRSELTSDYLQGKIQKIRNEWRIRTKETMSNINSIFWMVFARIVNYSEYCFIFSNAILISSESFFDSSKFSINFVKYSCSDSWALRISDS